MHLRNNVVNGFERIRGVNSSGRGNPCLSTNRDNHGHPLWRPSAALDDWMRLAGAIGATTRHNLVGAAALHHHTLGERNLKLTLENEVGGSCSQVSQDSCVNEVDLHQGTSDMTPWSHRLILRHANNLKISMMIIGPDEIMLQAVSERMAHPGRDHINKRASALARAKVQVRAHGALTFLRQRVTVRTIKPNILHLQTITYVCSEHDVPVAFS